MSWQASIPLPGIVPIQNATLGHPFLLTLESDFAGLGIDYFAGARPFEASPREGTGTPYQMACTPEDHRRRAWRLRGFRTITINGSVVFNTLAPGHIGGLSPTFGFSGALTIPEPASVALSHWVANVH